jgi:hypothetical protein
MIENPRQRYQKALFISKNYSIYPEYDKKSAAHRVLIWGIWPFFCLSRDYLRLFIHDNKTKTSEVLEHF